jgi:murein DD-endopeptidase MepM/ murein hydrolase activator NlpD/SH3-like domain-containing protein
VRLTRLALSLTLAAALGACEQVEVMVDERRSSTPHEAYLQGLHDAGLASTALSREWIAEAGEALENPTRVELPFQEEGYIAPEDPEAVGYRFELTRGQLLTVRLRVESREETRVFLDLMRVAEDPANPPRPVEADTLPDGSLRYEPYRDGEYLVRVQPELLRGGQYSVILTLDPALDFPVAGLGMGAIQSWWGAPREGGRRSHEGVDIFARRGTPVIASVPGRIRRTDLTNLGGKVVWLRDDRMNRSLYYAHLDSQAVRAGDVVEIGDTLGFVGNTGNARTTPPHLHFGIYYRGEGAVNPAPYLRPPRRRLAEFDLDRGSYGEWVRIARDGIYLRSAPSRSAEVRAELPGATPARVLGGAGDWYRVALPDGSRGYVAARLTEPLTGIEPLVAEAELPLRTDPARTAPRIAIATAGEPLEVTGRFGAYLQVRSASGALGWVEDPRGGTAAAAAGAQEQ